MPVAEEDATPKGEAYGAEKQQQEFTEATAAPIQSPVATPSLPEEGKPEKLQEHPQGAPNLDPNFGFNWDEALFAPTSRPGEPITAGTPGQLQKVSDILQRLDAIVGSPDLKGLLNTARSLGL